MCLVWLEAEQVLIVWCIKGCYKVIDNSGIFFLKNLLELALDLITLIIILTVVAYFVNEEKR